MSKKVSWPIFFSHFHFFKFLFFCIFKNAVLGMGIIEGQNVEITKNDEKCVFFAKNTKKCDFVCFFVSSTVGSPYFLVKTRKIKYFFSKKNLFLFFLNSKHAKKCDFTHCQKDLVCKYGYDAKSAVFGLAPQKRVILLFLAILAICAKVYWESYRGFLTFCVFSILYFS